MSRKIVSSAPGKSILHGEHAVVFGKVSSEKNLNYHLINLKI